MKRILLVEDDPDSSLVMSRLLRSTGYDVEAAHSIFSALGLAQAATFDLVLCDINMPVMSGFELLERLTAIAPRFGQMPFIFLTAFTDRDTELKGRRLGADDYVTKPIDFDVMTTIITARLGRVARNEIWPANVALNEREIEALTWAARGKTSAEIAKILELSKRTVDFHIDNARAKLGTASRVEAVVKAISGRLIEP